MPQLRPVPPAKDLHFGQHFSDHLFRAEWREGKGWLNPRIEPYGPISLDPAASVYHYGQALFEGMKAYRQPDGSIALFRPNFNVERMQAGAARLCLPPPPGDLFLKGLRDLIERDKRWVPEDEGCSLYVRPTLIGTEGFLGVRPAREALFYIILSPVGNYYSDSARGVRIWVEEKALRAAPGGLGATKAGANYAASLQAGHLAKQNRYDQVLWLDVSRRLVEEVGTMNVFFVFNDEIVTPPLNGSLLPGCVRDSVLRLLGPNSPVANAKPVRQREISIQEIADRAAKGELLEAFGTGTAAVISPIRELCWRENSIAPREPDKGPIASALLTELVGLHRGKRPDVFGWMKASKDLNH